MSAIIYFNIAVIAFLGAMWWWQSTARKDAEKRVSELAAELEKQKRNSAYLATHAAEIARIERSNNTLKGEIRNAKSDEEIADIINTVLDANNNLVRDNTDGK